MQCLNLRKRSERSETHYVSQVHHLQVLLNQHGYYCGEEETVWWQFGMDTYSSLLTFQVSISHHNHPFTQ